ncbi:DNA primase family protein [Glaciimonas soli]|uniref:SF3 helicase domain-containing protein n=1 Tax=Glaciimonas soli TaxID=2590999 RepID=A0A843YTF5_9BURK|nr:phage/plasmid primase, P4 family [Glaciimonas soli]MQR00984.1 hypothetical protein [Glaciimonas soli]
MKIIIRDAKSDDLDWLKELMVESMRDGHYLKQSSDTMRAMLQQIIECGVMFRCSDKNPMQDGGGGLKAEGIQAWIDVIEKDGEKVGFSLSSQWKVESEDREILCISTAKDYRKQGVPHLGLDAKPRHVAELIKMVFIQCDQSMDVIRPDPNFICFSNGTLNVATGILGPHSPAHMLLNRIPHPFSATATCGGFITFLSSVWANDTDRDQKIQLIRQWIGYLLVADSSMHKMLILKGEGANGKTVLMDLIREIIGEANTSSAMLDRLRLSYVRATMDGKLLNVSPDLPKKNITADGDLKAIVSGDAVEVALKHKQSHTIKPYVRLIVSTNNMPDCKDTSDGYFRRLMILTFNQQFAESERNPNLLQSLIPEIPGIIRWGLEGLYELRAQGRFTIPESSEQAVQIYREEISPGRLFAEECLVASTDRIGMLSKDIFMAFKIWCRERGFDAGNMITLGRELSALEFTSRKSNQSWWLVSATEAGKEYFRPASILPKIVQLLPDLGLALAA